MNSSGLRRVLDFQTRWASVRSPRRAQHARGLLHPLEGETIDLAQVGGGSSGGEALGRKLPRLEGRIVQVTKKPVNPETPRSQPVWVCTGLKGVSPPAACQAGPPRHPVQGPTAHWVHQHARAGECIEPRSDPRGVPPERAQCGRAAAESLDLYNLRTAKKSNISRTERISCPAGTIPRPFRGIQRR